MAKETHAFVAYSFVRGFKFGEIADELAAGPTRIDPKDAVKRQTEGGGYIYVYNFGVVAFWNVALAERQREIERLRERYPHTYAEIIVSDDFVVEVDPESPPRVDFSRLILDKMTPGRAEVIALTLAQSTNMEYYENMVEVIRGQVNMLTRNVREHGRTSMRLRRWYKFIGEAMTVKNEVVGVLHVLDRPDLIWEDRTMDGLYDDLRAVFDLQERFQALTYKLANIQDSLEIFIDMSRDSRIFLVELAIVALIFAELFVSLFH